MSVTTHMCRGNFRSSWVAEGGYDHVAEALFHELEVDGYFMEWDDERSGGFEPLRLLPKGEKQVVLGLATTKRGAARVEGRSPAADRGGEPVRAARPALPVPAVRVLLDGRRERLDLRRAGGEARAGRRGRRGGLGAVTGSLAGPGVERLSGVSGMMGQRILRVEDGRFLRGRASTWRTSSSGRAPCDVRPLSRRACAHRRDRRLGRRELPGSAGVHRGGRRAAGVPAPADPGDQRQDGAAFLASDVVRFVGDIVAVVLTEVAQPAPTPPSSCSSTTTLCPPSSTPKRRSPETCSCIRSSGRTSARAIRSRLPTRRCSRAATLSSRAGS